MTARPTETYTPRPWLPWMMLLAGLIVGFIVGRMTASMAQARLGNCVTRDTVVITGVSQKECQAECPTCTWTQSR